MGFGLRAIDMVGSREALTECYTVGFDLFMAFENNKLI